MIQPRVAVKISPLVKDKIERWLEQEYMDRLSGGPYRRVSEPVIYDDVQTYVETGSPTMGLLARLTKQKGEKVLKTWVFQPSSKSNETRVIITLYKTELLQEVQSILEELSETIEKSYGVTVISVVSLEPLS